MQLNQNFSDFFDQSAAAPKPAQPKPAEPKPAAPAEDKFAGVPAWTDIQAKPEFQALPPAKQAEAKQAYFDYWIAPRVGQDADDIRQQFLGAPQPAAAQPAVDEQAGQAAFGIYPKAKSAAKARPTPGQLLMQPVTIPDQEFTSRVPARPEVRRAFEAAWNAATPGERLQMEAAPGWTGQLARERAGYAKMRDEARAGASEAMRATMEGLDPRAEFRAARLRAQGEDPRFAETAGREGARRGALPGQEIKALDGTIQKSEYDFDTARFFDPNNPANGANNALVRGVTKGALGIAKTYAGLFQFQSDLIGFDAASKSAAGFGQSVRGKEEAIGERGTFLERNFEGAVSSIAQQLPLLLTGVAAASQAIPLAGMALQSFGQEYSDGRAKGQNTGQAAIRASMFAAFEVIGERFGLGAQMDALRAAARGMPTSEIANLLFSALKKEIPGELLTTTGQFSVDKFAGSGIGLNPNATFNDYMKQVADTIAQTIMQSGMMGAGTTGVATGVRYLRDRGPNAAVADADADAVKRTALAKWAEFLRGGAPAANQTVDGRIEPTIDVSNIPAVGGGSGPGGGIEPSFGDPLVQTADDIVRGMATDAGLPESTVLPGAATAAPAVTQADQDILDFADTRFQQLRDKRGTPEEPGPGLSPTETQELQVLVQARGNPVALREFYGIDQPGEADVRQTEESLDGAPSGPAAGTQGQAAAAQVPEQPGQQPNEDGQAQGLGQAIDGLGALFGGQQQETEAEREARLEREAIQGESEIQVADEQADDDIQFDLPPPRTEKEARERKEQQANVQAGQAQQTQAPPEEAVSATAAPPAEGAPAAEGVEAPRKVKLYRGVQAGKEDQPTVGDALFMSPDRKVAETYAGEGGTVTEVDADFKNLLDVPKWTDAKSALGLGQEATMSDIVNAARKAGYDGVTFNTTNGREYISIGPKPKTEREAIEQRQQEAVTRRENAPDGMQVHVFRTSDGFGTGLYDADAGEYVNGSVTRFTGQDAEANANARADEVLKKATPPAEKPKTEREARQQRLAEKPLPAWTQRNQGFPANTTFAWEQDGDNVVLVAKVGDKEFGRVAESQVKDGTSVGTMKLTKALVDESLRQAGGTTELNWTPEGGDTSVEDAKKRKEQSKDNRSRAKRQLEAAIEKADEAGAMKTKSKLVDLLMAFDRKDKGPAQVTKALESLDADIEKETTVKTPVSEEEKLVTAISEVTFDKGTVQDFIDKHGKAAFKRALELGYIDNTLEFPTSKLFATNKVVYELQQKYYQFPIGKRPVRKKPEKPQKTQAQGGTTSPEGAGGSQPTPAPNDWVEGTTVNNWKSWTKDYGNGLSDEIVQSGPRSFTSSLADATGSPSNSFRTLEEAQKASAEAAARRQAAPAAPTLEGVKVKFDVMVEDTGQTASMTVDAAAQMKEYDEREKVLRELIACLQK